MTEQIKAIREWSNVTRGLFEEEIRPLRQPAVMRALVPDWPLVRKGRSSSAEAVQYLNRFYSGKPVGTMHAAATEHGRLFYNDDLTGYNFQRTMQNMRLVLHELLELESKAHPPTMVMQAVNAPDHLPGFDSEQVLELVPSVHSRLWIGNAALVAPHYDLFENIACVAVGRRRFTLFPPEQLPNLYVGPLDNTPSGAPISMVDLRAPDFARYPRFALALAAAQGAELAPGDAIYIPYMWWHGVEALDPFNVLVNYWWQDSAVEAAVPPRVAMMVARLAIKDMAPEQIALWKAMFDHYVFNGADDAMAHLPPHARGIFGDLTPQQRRAARQTLARLLTDI